jgi:negative regulator of replication initiation
MDIALIPIAPDVLVRLLALRSTDTESLNETLRRVLAEQEVVQGKASLPMPNCATPKVHTGPRSVCYFLNGEECSASDATEAMIAILNRLARQHVNFFEMLTARVRGRTRNHLARSRAEVYPERPDLVRYVREVVPGWFIGCNIANREKKRILRAACELSGLTYGRDLKLNMNNA